MRANKPLHKTCQEFLDAFFERYPNDELREKACQALASLLGRRIAMIGTPGGWAGGIVYAVGSRGCGVSGVMNLDLEQAFCTTMGTIRKRSHQIKQELRLDAPLSNEGVIPSEKFSIQDHANALCAYAFRNGPIEDIHADGRISDPEMRNLMINASKRLAKLLTMKQETPTEYERFIRNYHWQRCQNWER